MAARCSLSPPTDLEESERDSQLERFIRKKYESRAFSSASALTSPTNSTSPTTSLSTAAPPTTNRDSALALGVPTRSSSAIGRRQVRSQAPLHSSTHLGDRSTGQHSSLASSLQYHQPATGSQSFTSPAPPVRPSTAPIPHAIQPHLAPPVPPIPSHMTFSSLSQCTAPYQTNMYTHSSVVSAPSFPVSNTPMAPTSSIRSDGVWGDLLSLVPSTGPSQAHTVASNTGYRPAMQTTPRPADPSFAMASFSQQAPSFAPSNQSLIMLNSMTTPQDQQHNPFNSSMPLEHVDQVPVSSSTGTSNAFNMSNFLPEHMRQQARPTNPFYTSPALSHVSQPSNNPYTNVVMPNQTFQQHPGSFFSQPPTQTMQVPHPGGSYPNHYASVPNFTQPVQSQASPFHPPFY